MTPPEIDREKLAKIIVIANTDFINGEFKILAPEAKFIALCRAYEQQYSSPEFALRALFYTLPLTRGQKTIPQFEKISSPQLIEQHAGIFDPRTILQTEPQITFEACQTFFNPAGFPRRIINDTWLYNSDLLLTKYSGKLENFFKAHNSEAPKILRALIVRPRAKREEKIRAGAFLGFGIKIATLFLQWVNQYNLYPLKEMDKIGIPVDSQITKLLVHTGALQLPPKGANADLVTRRTILPAIIEFLKKEDNPPSHQISAMLWTLGSQYCPNNRHNSCPLKEICPILPVSLKHSKFYPS